MNSKTAYNHQQRLLNTLNQIYRDARDFCWSSDELIDRLKVVWEDKAKVPNHVKSYLRGYAKCLWDNHWQHVEWVHPWKGVMYKSWTDLPEDGKEYYRGKYHSGLHVYKKNNRKHFTGLVAGLNAGLEEVTK